MSKTMSPVAWSQWRRDQVSRLAVANGSALGTCALMVAARPSLKVDLAVPAVLFAVATIIAMAQPLVDRAERGAIEDLQAADARVQLADANLTSTGSVASAVEILEAREAAQELIASGPITKLQRTAAQHAAVMGVLFLFGLLWGCGAVFLHPIEAQPDGQIEFKHLASITPATAPPPTSPSASVSILLPPGALLEIRDPRQPPTTSAATQPTSQLGAASTARRRGR